MAHYATYKDLTGPDGVLDRRVFPDDDRGTIEPMLMQVELKVDARLQRYFDVPFDAEQEPESYEMVHMIVVDLAAAQYVRQTGQAAANETWAWAARNWDAAAEALLKLMETERAPVDAVPAADPVSHLPSDGLEAEAFEHDGMQHTVHNPFITRAHVTPGHPRHF